MREGAYQNHVIKRLVQTYPGCMVLKNDPVYIQGIPDLIFLIEDFWGMLEVKISARAHKQPNQEFYINKLNQMSYADFIYPECEESVFNDIQQAFSAHRNARVFESE